MSTFPFPVWPNGSLRACFASECPECGEMIHEGANIAYSPAHGGYTHAACPAPPATVRRGEVSCPTCFLIHPEGACDR